MNETLKRELKEYYTIVKSRTELIDKEMGGLKLFYELDTKLINKRLGDFAIKLLLQKGFDFEKDRLDGTQLSVEEDGLNTRGYRLHRKNVVTFLNNSGGDWRRIYTRLPSGFPIKVGELIERINSYNKLQEQFRDKDDYRTYWGNTKKVIVTRKMKNKFSCLNDYRENYMESNVVEVKFSVTGDGDKVFLDFKNEKLVYYDKVFNIIMEELKLLKLKNDEAIEKRDKEMKIINEILEEDKFMVALVAEEL